MTAQFRWSAGTLTKAAIQADTTATLPSFTRYGRRWVVDIAPVIDRFIVEELSLANTMGEFGGINFTVSFMAANGAMYDFLQTKFFASGAREEPQTLQVYDLPEYPDQWITVNCIGRSPGRKASLMNPRSGLIPYLTYTFFDGVIAASGE